MRASWWRRQRRLCGSRDQRNNRGLVPVMSGFSKTETEMVMQPLAGPDVANQSEEVAAENLQLTALSGDGGGVGAAI